jgi:phosphatidylglycerophosphate synthase
MMDGMTRRAKEMILIPAARSIGKILSPNGVTLISLLLGLAACPFILIRRPGWALLFWALNRITDGLDGTVARISGRQSDFGAYLDIMVDFVIYAALPLCLTLAYPSALLWPVLAVMLGLFYINGASWMYLSALLEKNRAGAAASGEMTSVTMPTSLVEGTETIILYTLFLIFPDSLVLLFSLMSLLLVPGILYRLFWARKHLN